MPGDCIPLRLGDLQVIGYRVDFRRAGLAKRYNRDALNSRVLFYALSVRRVIDARYNAIPGRVAEHSAATVGTGEAGDRFRGHGIST